MKSYCSTVHMKPIRLINIWLAFLNNFLGVFSFASSRLSGAKDTLVLPIWNKKISEKTKTRARTVRTDGDPSIFQNVTRHRNYANSSILFSDVSNLGETILNAPTLHYSILILVSRVAEPPCFGGSGSGSFPTRAAPAPSKKRLRGGSGST